MGQVAVTTMLERIANPQAPPRTILMQTSLVVRKSCGATP
jgi:DNA-binding LacI/PurR family transcriptional regulator